MVENYVTNNSKQIRIPIRIVNPATGKTIAYYGLLDTGASRSGIAKSRVEELGLVPSNKTITLATPNVELMTKPIYVIDYELIDGVRIHGLEISEFPIEEADVLIGTDILFKFNILITQDDRKTYISIQFPPSGKVLFPDE